MRVDLDEIAARIARRRAAEAMFRVDPETERRRRREELLRRIELPFAPLLEGRLLANILSDHAVLVLCDDVEVDDFAHFPHGWIFAALRAVQARGAWTAANGMESLDAIGEELDRTDKRDDKHQRAIVGDLFLAELIGRHMWESYGPPGAPIAEWVRHDARSLRELADRRRAL